MPTASQVISQVADESGLDATLDAAALLRAFNRAARRIAADFRRLLVAPTDLTTPTGMSFALPAAILSVKAIYVGTSATGPWDELDHSTLDAVMEAQSTGTAPKQYAIIPSGGTLTLLTDAPMDNFTIRVYGMTAPTALVGTETEAQLTAATGIPPLYHEDMLAQLALTYILEGYEGDEQRAAYYRNQYDVTAKDFRKWLGMRGGDDAANSRAGAGHFSTPDPLTVR